MSNQKEVSALLLLDLDGVVVLEHGPPWLERLEILRLHDSLLQFLQELPAPIVVVTHRSRAEAGRILLAAGVGKDILRHVVAAEDLALAALRHRGIVRLMTRGLRKSLVLPALEMKYGVDRRNMAFIDDRQDNIDDMLEHGLGLAIHAPSSVTESGDIITFSTSEVTEVFRRWQNKIPVPRLLRLAPRSVTVAECGRTGVCTTASGSHAFNRLRLVAQRARRAWQ